MKVISYSIFKAPCEKFEFMVYLRGLYFNARMNRLIYPEWRTLITYDEDFEGETLDFIWKLALKTNAILCCRGHEDLCKSMLWRMAPLFQRFELDGEVFNITHLICRDADAITTYKEAQAVQEWVDSGLGFHSITDNPAHSLPMMGGMVGFKVDHFRAEFPQWSSFEQMIKGQDLSKRGSDQDFMMKKIYPFAKPYMMGHFFDGCREKVLITNHTVTKQIPGVDPRLWESNLTCRHIGSAGVVEMELLRFFKRFDKADYSEFEKEFSEICYWAR